TMPAQQQAQPELPHDETEARLLLIRAKLNQLSVQQELAEQAEAERQRPTKSSNLKDDRPRSTRPVCGRRRSCSSRGSNSSGSKPRAPQSGSRKAEEATSDVDSNVVDDEDNDGDEECDDDDEEIDDGIDDNGDNDGSLLNGLEDDLEEDDNSTMSIDTGGGSSLLASRRPSAAAGAAAVAGPRQPAVIASLFPNVPPVLRFSAESDPPPEPLPWAQRRQLKWRMSSITPVVVKRAIARSGFRVAKKSHEWLGYFGKHMKPEGFKGVREYQKVNHFPGSFTIGRKDRLWRCLHRMQCQYGRREFDFFPLTFCLPGDLKQLRRAWDDAGAKQKWIVKPRPVPGVSGSESSTSGSRCRNGGRPYLINGSKFDLRVYVYVTSFDPLRVYVHERGLVRFASVPYSRSGKTIGNRFMHLTNYSVNKRNINYSASGGEAEESDGEGHKWTPASVVKPSAAALRYCVHRAVRALDILLDDRLKPWLLEVNISPSLHSNSLLDIEVKSAVIRDFMNLAGFQLPEPRHVDRARLSFGFGNVDKWQNSTSEAAPQRPDDRSILDTLTPDDVRVLVESMDEFARRAGEVRGLASRRRPTRRYLGFMEQPRYYNLLLMHHLSRYRACESQGIDALAAMCRPKIAPGVAHRGSAHQWSAPCGRRH
uniref:Tubulin polyglutamylase ttll4 n=1 Tax=Macrostomum lignano TaxID=282301 RepID=A0A1I8GTA8_9PLAT